MNTHFSHSLPALAGLIFHETAHRVLYIKSDTAYNEAFATFIGHTGQYLWICKHYGQEEAGRFLVHEKRSEEIYALLANTREELREVYKKKLSPEKMRAMKQLTFDEMRAKYAELKKTWNGYAGYDGWMSAPFNNADIIEENEYRNLVPFFQKLFLLSGKNFPVFYEKAERIAKLPKLERYLEIEKIMGQ